MTDISRYDDKPLLVIIENYILDVIGELNDENRKLTEKVVLDAFAAEGDWHEALRKTLGLTIELDDELNALWAKNQQIAIEDQIELTPVAFAQMIDDDNFAN